MAVALDKALADERRAQLVSELQRTPGGLDAQELGQRLHLHPNTVRWHLGILERAGGVSGRAVPRATRGRPRIQYRLRTVAKDGTRDEYRLLATILTGTLTDRDGGAAVAEEAGRAWGRYLVERPLPLAHIHDDEAIAHVTGLLEEQGFAPEPSAAAIRMHRCPFHELAATSPEIVCAVHRGLIAGALEELGSQLEVTGLDVFPEPDVCAVHLARRSY